MLRKYSIYDADAEEWISILKLSYQWNFSEIKQMACRYLEEFEIDPIRKIELYQAYEVDRRLLIPAYTAIVNRTEPLTLEEGRRLSLETALLIATARECARGKLQSGKHTPVSASVKPDAMVDIIKEVFSLPDRTPASPSLGPLAEGRGPSAFTATPMSPSRIITTALPQRDGAKSPTPMSRATSQPYMLTPAAQPQAPVPPTPSNTVPPISISTASSRPADSKVLAPDVPPYLQTSFSQGSYATGAPNTPLKSAASSGPANVPDLFNSNGNGAPAGANGSAKPEADKSISGQSSVVRPCTSCRHTIADFKSLLQKTETAPRVKTSGRNSKVSSKKEPTEAKETQPRVANKEGTGRKDRGEAGSSRSSGYHTNVTNSADDAGVVGNEIDDVATSTSLSGPKKEESESQSKTATTAGKGEYNLTQHQLEHIADTKYSTAQGSKSTATTASAAKPSGKQTKAGKTEVKPPTRSSTPRPEVTITIPSVPQTTDAGAEALAGVLPQLLANNSGAANAPAPSGFAAASDVPEPAILTDKAPAIEVPVPPAAASNQNTARVTGGAPDPAPEKAMTAEASASKDVGAPKVPAKDVGSTKKSHGTKKPDAAKKPGANEPEVPEAADVAPDGELEKRATSAEASAEDVGATNELSQESNQPAAPDASIRTTLSALDKEAEELKKLAGPKTSVAEDASATEKNAKAKAAEKIDSRDAKLQSAPEVEGEVTKDLATAAPQDISPTDGELAKDLVLAAESTVPTGREKQPAGNDQESGSDSAWGLDDDLEKSKDAAEQELLAEPVVVKHEDAVDTDASAASIESKDPVTADAVIVQPEDAAPPPAVPEVSETDAQGVPAAGSDQASLPPAEQKDEVTLVDPKDVPAPSDTQNTPANEDVTKAESPPPIAKAVTEILESDAAVQQASAPVDEPEAATTLPKSDVSQAANATVVPQVDQKKTKPAVQPATPQTDATKAKSTTGAEEGQQTGTAPAPVSASVPAPKQEGAPKAKASPANASATGATLPATNHPPPTISSKPLEPKTPVWAPQAKHAQAPSPATGARSPASSRPASLHSLDPKASTKGLKTPSVTSPPADSPRSSSSSWGSVGNRMRGLISKAKGVLDSESEPERVQAPDSAVARAQEDIARLSSAQIPPSSKPQDQPVEKREVPKATSTQATPPPPPKAAPADQKAAPEPEKLAPQEKQEIEQQKEQQEEKPTEHETPSKPSLRVDTGSGVEDSTAEPALDDDDVPLAAIASSVPKHLQQQQQAEDSDATESEPPSSRPDSPEVEKGTLTKSQKKKLKDKAKLEKTKRAGKSK